LGLELLINATVFYVYITTGNTQKKFIMVGLCELDRIYILLDKVK